MLMQFNSAETAPQLFCAPFAGGSANSYRELAAHLKSEFEVYAHNPPGRLGTDAHRSLDLVIDDFHDHLQDHLQRPFVLFGHSMGGLVVHRLAQRLEEKGIKPLALIVSGCASPNFRRKKTFHLPTDEFYKEIIDLDGIPSAIQKEKTLLMSMEALFRADFEAVETYHNRDHRFVNTPTYVIYGTEDKMSGLMSDWCIWANVQESHKMEGGHMYLLQNAESVARWIKDSCGIYSPC